MEVSLALSSGLPPAVDRSVRVLVPQALCALCNLSLNYSWVLSVTFQHPQCPGWVSAFMGTALWSPGESRLQT